MSEQIDKLKAEAYALNEALRAKKQELWDAQCEACPFKPGDLVYEDGEPFKVVSIKYPERNWVVGARRKKDGTWSRQEKVLYHPEHTGEKA